MSMSFVPLLPRPRRCSRQDTRRIATAREDVSFVFFVFFFCDLLIFVFVFVHNPPW